MKQNKLNNKKQDNLSLESCPNCWGYQEYGGICIKSIYTKSLGWIQDYFNRFLNKI